MLSREAKKELLLSIEENQILDALFEHPGMKIFQEKAREMRTSYDSLSRVSNTEQLFFKKGQLDILDWFLNWHESVKETLAKNVEIAETLSDEGESLVD